VITSSGVIVGFEKIIYATAPPPTMTMASTLNLRPVHFLKLDLAPRLPQQFLYFFPLPQGQGSFCRTFDDIFLYSFLLLRLLRLIFHYGISTLRKIYKYLEKSRTEAHQVLLLKLFSVAGSDCMLVGRVPNPALAGEKPDTPAIASGFSSGSCRTQNPTYK
jgi:hypothetical protein